MDDGAWIWGVRAAGGFHLLTVALACLTPIPPQWEENLARLPELHRRFAVAQNFSIGATIVFAGLVCLALAPALVAGTPAARAICAGLALLWGGRLAILPWIGVSSALTSPWLRAGFGLLCAQCAIYAAAFGWLAVRPA